MVSKNRARVFKWYQTVSKKAQNKAQKDKAVRLEEGWPREN
jgi:hypothetical protein